MYTYLLASYIARQARQISYVVYSQDAQLHSYQLTMHSYLPDIRQLADWQLQCNIAGSVAHTVMAGLLRRARAGGGGGYRDVLYYCLVARYAQLIYMYSYHRIASQLYYLASISISNQYTIYNQYTLQLAIAISQLGSKLLKYESKISNVRLIPGLIS